MWFKEPQFQGYDRLVFVQKVKEYRFDPQVISMRLVLRYVRVLKSPEVKG